MRSMSHTCLAWAGRCREEGQEHPSPAGKTDPGLGKQLCCTFLLIPPQQWAVRREVIPWGMHKQLSINHSPSLRVPAASGAVLLALSITSAGPVTSTWLICCPKSPRFGFGSCCSCSQGPSGLAAGGQLHPSCAVGSFRARGMRDLLSIIPTLGTGERAGIQKSTSRQCLVQQTFI